MDDPEIVDRLNRLAIELAAVSLVVSEVIAEEARKKDAPQRYIQNIKTGANQSMAKTTGGDGLLYAGDRISLILNHAQTRLKAR
jgi:hypothetical protein